MLFQMIYSSAIERVLVIFKCRKQKNSTMYKRKNLGTKSQELANLRHSGRLFVCESMSHENQQLVYECENFRVPVSFSLPASLTML